MTNREMQKHIASELLTKVFVFNQLEIEIYALLKNSKINLALIAEACGMQRNTAYYRHLASPGGGRRALPAHGRQPGGRRAGLRPTGCRRVPGRPGLHQARNNFV